MTLIKPLLVLGILALLLWAFRHRRRVGIRAGTRLVAIVLGAAAIAAVADPGITQRLADVAGVKRGTDLVLYILVIVFGFAQAGTYFKFREIEIRMAKVVRLKAIQDALREDGPPGRQA